MQEVVVISSRDEMILKAVHHYRYMTAQDVAYLLFEPSSITHVREILSNLAGGGDNRDNQYLYRFKLPNTTTGNSERVYTLGSRGRGVLIEAFGIPVDWFFRPNKLRYASYSHLTHSLLLTRFLVASQVWVKRSDFRIIDVRISYQLASTPQGVIPDAWILFEKEKKSPLWLEIDRGTEYQQKFKQHIRSRIEFVRSGAYAKFFGIPAVLIAYVTTGERPEYRETRVRTMCGWTGEVLEEMGLQKWASIFRFAGLPLNDMYKQVGVMFEEAVWFRPDQQAAVQLFG